MLPHDDISDAELDGWLHTLGVTSRCQWDVLVFLYRHQSSLVGADLIARLLGYASNPVVAALDVLEGLGLVKRSRVSQMVRLYQFTTLSAPRGVTPGPASWPSPATAAAGCASPRACGAVTNRTRTGCRRPRASWPGPSRPCTRPNGGGTHGEETSNHG